MDTLPNEFSIYSGTTRIARIGRPTPREAFKEASSLVRQFAHCDGVGGFSIERPDGRVCISAGIFRALPTVKGGW